MLTLIASRSEKNACGGVKDTRVETNSSSTTPRTNDEVHETTMRKKSLMKAGCDNVATACLASGDGCDVLGAAHTLYDIRTLASALHLAYATNGEPAESNRGGQCGELTMTAAIPAKKAPDVNKTTSRTLKSADASNRHPSSLLSSICNDDVLRKVAASKGTRKPSNPSSSVCNDDVQRNAASSTRKPSNPSSSVCNHDVQRKRASKDTRKPSNLSSSVCNHGAQRNVASKTTRQPSNPSSFVCNDDVQRKAASKVTRKPSNPSSVCNHDVQRNGASKTTRKPSNPSSSFCKDDVLRKVTSKETAMTFKETEVKTETGARLCWKDRRAERVRRRCDSSSDARGPLRPRERTGACSPFSAESSWSADQGADSIPTIRRKYGSGDGSRFSSTAPRSLSRGHGGGCARKQGLARGVDKAKTRCAQRLKDDPEHSGACLVKGIDGAAEAVRVLRAVKGEVDVELALDSIPGSPSPELGEACSVYGDWKVSAERWLASDEDADEQHETQRQSRSKKCIGDPVSVSKPIPASRERDAWSEGWEGAAERWLASDDSAVETNERQKRPRSQRSGDDLVSVSEPGPVSSERGDPSSEGWEAAAERWLANNNTTDEENERHKRPRREKCGGEPVSISEPGPASLERGDTSSEGLEAAAENWRESASDEESTVEAKVDTARVTWADVWPLAAISKRELLCDESDQSPTATRRHDDSSPLSRGGRNEEVIVSAAKRTCLCRVENCNQAQILEMLCTADASHPCAGFYRREMDGGYYHVDDPSVYMARHALYWTIYRNSRPVLYCAVNNGLLPTYSEGPEMLTGTWRVWDNTGMHGRMGNPAPMCCFDLRDPYFRLLRSLLPCRPIAKCYKQWCEMRPRKDLRSFLSALPQSLWTRLGKHLMCKETVADMIRVILDRFALHEYAFFSRAFLESLSKKIALDDITVDTCVTDEGFDTMVQALLEMKLHYPLDSMAPCSNAAVDPLVRRMHYMQGALSLPSQFWRDLCTSLVDSGNCHREWTFYTEISPAEATKEQLIAFIAGLFSGSTNAKEKAAQGLGGFIVRSSKI